MKGGRQIVRVGGGRSAGSRERHREGARPAPSGLAAETGYFGLSFNRTSLGVSNIITTE